MYRIKVAVSGCRRYSLLKALVEHRALLGSSRPNEFQEAQTLALTGSPWFLLLRLNMTNDGKAGQLNLLKSMQKWY